MQYTSTFRYKKFSPSVRNINISGHTEYFMTPVVILIWVFCFLTTTSAIPSHFPNSIQVINSNSYGSSDRKAKFESQIPSTTTRNWKCRNWKDNALRCCKMKFRNAFNGLRNRKDLISDNNGMERRTFRKVNFWSRAFRIYRWRKKTTLIFAIWILKSFQII